MNDKLITRNIKQEFELYTTEQIRKYSIDNSYPYAILSLNIQSNLNMGNMLRSAHLCGCRKFIIFGRRKYDKRSSVGVYNYIDIERIQGLKHPEKDLTTELHNLDYVFDDKVFYNFINDNNYIPIFVEQSSNSTKATSKNISYILDNIPLGKIPIFIFGNEGTGIPRNILETHSLFKVSYILELNQCGALQSYNVSNTCAIISYMISLHFMNEI